MIDKKYQIGVPIVNPEEKMMPSAPAIRKYVSGIQGGRIVEIAFKEGNYFQATAEKLSVYGKMTIPAGTPVYVGKGEHGAYYTAGNLNWDTGTSKYTEEFSTEGFVGVLMDDLVVEKKDIVKMGGNNSGVRIPASIMTVGSVNINATGIGASWFAELFGGLYQGIKFESDEVATVHNDAV